MKLISLRSLTAIAVLAAPMCAQGVLPYLPKKTMMAISAPDLSMSMAEFRQMPLAKMWAEDEVQTFVADVLEMAKEKMDEGLDQAREMHKQGMLPVDPDKLMKLRVNGGTFAITNMEMTQGDFGPMPKFGIVLHLDFGESAETWNQLIQMGLGMLQQQAGDKATMTEWSIGDVKAMTMAPNGGPQGLEMSLNVAMVPGGLLIGTLTDDIKTIVGNMNNKTPELSQTAGFAAATKRMDTAGAEAQMFMSPDSMVDFGMSTLRMAIENEPDMAMVDFDGVERAMSAMGMRDLGTMAMSTSYQDGKCITKAFHANGANAKTAAAKTIDTKFLKWVPKDAVSFSAGTLDVASLYDTLVKGLMAYDPKVAEQMLGHLGQIESQLGFTIRGDLFGSLGDHYITWSMPMGTISSAPEMAFLMKVNNEEKLVGALKNMAALSNGVVEIEEGTKRGLKSYQVAVNFEMDGMGMNPFDMFQPTFAFKDGYMVLGFSASDVKRVFKRMDREDNPKGDIRSNKEFMAIANQIPEGVSSISFTDWKANFESLYQLATGVLAFVPMPEDVPIDMSLLPDSETLTQHLFASLNYTKTDANGTETVDVSPFGPETWLAIGALVGGAIGVGSVMGARGGF